MLTDVGQRLLHHPEDGLSDRSLNPAHIALDPKLAAQWALLQQSAKRAHRSNKTNGVLIRTRMDYNQRAQRILAYGRLFGRWNQGYCRREFLSSWWFGLSFRGFR